VATLAVWRSWPSEAPVATAPADPSRRRARWPLQATAIVLAYGLVAAGLVPHMVFLVDYVARGLGAGIGAGATYWVLFGLGATAGPTVAGLVADRTGFAFALYAAIALQVVAVAWLVVASDAVALSFSSIVIGAFVPGNVPLVLGRTQEIFSDPRERQSAWSTATVVFAIGQAASAYCLSSVFSYTGGGYRVLFALGALALAAAFAVQLIGEAATRLSRQTSKS
jgi:predicted MFS family arabinose efflux permease